MQKAQALVETMLIAPILIFFLIGVFEVGWQIRAYLILTNADREAARFAVRPGYMDYTEASYKQVVKHGLDSISGQIEVSGTVIISVIRIETGQVCDPNKRKADSSLDCDCDEAITSPYSPTLVLSPLSSLTMTYKYPATSTESTRLDYQTLIDEAIEHNRLFNCKLQLAGSVPAIDEQVTVEMFHYQSQLFGFPLISNPLTDPVRQYASTTFRKVGHR